MMIKIDLDCVVDSADPNKWQGWMSLDDIHDRTVTFVYAVNPAGMLVPDKHVAVIRARCDELVVRSEEVHW
jgi:hypothetical protein